MGSVIVVAIIIILRRIIIDSMNQLCLMWTRDRVRNDIIFRFRCFGGCCMHI